MMEQQLATLKTWLKEVTDLERAAEVLSWDQQVNMPPGGAEARAEQLATLQKLAHERFTRDEVGLLLADLAQVSWPDESDEAAFIRVAQRDYDRARKVPSSLVTEMSRTFSLGQQVWEQAKEQANFAHFQGILEKIIDLNRQLAEAYGYDTCPYDALLDSYEPNMKTAQVQTVFDELKATLVPLVQAISAHSERVDSTLLQQNYEVEAQWAFGMEVLAAIGFDLQRGRQDKSVHPFTMSFSANDVRITTRVTADSFPSALFSTLHEGGHGLYEQNVAQHFEGTPLTRGTSLGVHESQSRLWENVLGRGYEFWQFYYPKLQNYFPAQLGTVPLETFYRAINQVKPSLIRVEADEVTYNLHIFLRFELEQALLMGQLKVADLPAAWNEKMHSYLGLTPPHDGLGVLQDVHWSAGLIGYFPTYTLGNIMSLQFYEQTLRDMPDLPAQFAQGNFTPLLEWFRAHVHRHGRKFTANELIQQATSAAGLDARPYLHYITQKFGQIYGL